MALSHEVHLGLPHLFTSHVLVMHPCTFPTSAYGLLVGLPAVLLYTTCCSFSGFFYYYYSVSV